MDFHDPWAPYRVKYPYETVESLEYIIGSVFQLTDESAVPLRQALAREGIQSYLDLLLMNNATWLAELAYPSQQHPHHLVPLHSSYCNLISNLCGYVVYRGDVLGDPIGPNYQTINGDDFHEYRRTDFCRLEWTRDYDRIRSDLASKRAQSTTNAKGTSPHHRNTVDNIGNSKIDYHKSLSTSSNPGHRPTLDSSMGRDSNTLPPDLDDRGTETQAPTIASTTDKESSDEANDSSNVPSSGISGSTIRSTLNYSIDGDIGASLSGHHPNDAAKPIDLVSTPSEPSVPTISAPIGDSLSSISGSSMGRVTGEAFDVVGARSLAKDDDSNSKDQDDSTNKSNRNLVYSPISPASALEDGLVSIVEGDGMGSGSNGPKYLTSTFGPVHGTPTKLIPYCSTSSPAMSSKPREADNGGNDGGRPREANTGTGNDLDEKGPEEADTGDAEVPPKVDESNPEADDSCPTKSSSKTSYYDTGSILDCNIVDERIEHRPSDDVKSTTDAQATSSPSKPKETHKANSTDRLAADSILDFQEASMGSDCEGTLLPRADVSSSDNVSKIFDANNKPTHGKLNRNPTVLERSPKTSKRNGPKRRRKDHSVDGKAQRNKRSPPRSKRQQRKRKPKPKANKQEPKRIRSKRRQNESKSQQTKTSEQVDSSKTSETVILPSESTSYSAIVKAKEPRLDRIVKTNYGKLHRLTPNKSAKVHFKDEINVESKIECSNDSSTIISTLLSTDSSSLDHDFPDSGSEIASVDESFVETIDGNISVHGTDESTITSDDQQPSQHGAASATPDQLAHVGDKRSNSSSLQLEPLVQVDDSKSIKTFVTFIESNLDTTIESLEDFGNTEAGSCRDHLWTPPQPPELVNIDRDSIDPFDVDVSHITIDEPSVFGADEADDGSTTSDEVDNSKSVFTTFTTFMDSTLDDVIDFIKTFDIVTFTDEPSEEPPSPAPDPISIERNIVDSLYIDPVSVASDVGPSHCEASKHPSFPDAFDDVLSDVERVDVSRSNDITIVATDDSILDDSNFSATINSDRHGFLANPTIVPDPPSISLELNSNSYWKPNEKDGERPHKDREKDGEWSTTSSQSHRHFEDTQSTSRVTATKNPSSAVKSRDHDWERLHRRFTWLPKLVIQKANNYSNKRLVSTPGIVDGHFHRPLNSNYDPSANTLATNHFDIEHGGLFPHYKLESNPLADGSSIPWTLDSRSQLGQRHVVSPTHHVMKDIAPSMLSFQSHDAANDRIDHSKQL